MLTEQMIQVDNIVYEYPGKRALKGVSFQIKPATVTALVGPNGAGKTTLLRCMAALERPFSGSISIDGLDTIENPREIHRKLGYLSDFFGLYDDLTVEQCLTYAAMSHGIDESLIDNAVERSSFRVGLKDRLDIQAKALSRGLRQRLAVGQAIIHEPEVVLLDEPASGLDPEARISLANMLSELREQGMTLIVSSHILSELESYSTHMLTIRDGEITGHRAIDDEGESVQERVKICVDNQSAAVELIESFENVVVEKIESTSIRVSIEGGESARSQLLSAMVTQNLAVSEFALEKRRLEEVYMDEAAGGGHA